MEAGPALRRDSCQAMGHPAHACTHGVSSACPRTAVPDREGVARRGGKTSLWALLLLIRDTSKRSSSKRQLMNLSGSGVSGIKRT